MKKYFFIWYCIFFAGIVIFAGCSSQSLMNEQKRIIFFGDSITELGVKPNGYVTLLRDSLAQQNTPYEIIGAGVSGNKISDLLARVDRDVLSKNPGIVVIYIGINDVWHFAFASRGLSGTPKPVFQEGLTTLIETLKLRNIRVLLCTPSVIGEKTGGTNTYDAMLDEYSAVSRETAEKENIPLCDLRTAFKEYLALHNTENKEKGILTYDGVHLSDEGNRLAAQQILASLKKSIIQ